MNRDCWSQAHHINLYFSLPQNKVFNLIIKNKSLLCSNLFLSSWKPFITHSLEFHRMCLDSVFSPQSSLQLWEFFNLSIKSHLTSWIFPFSASLVIWNTYYSHINSWESLPVSSASSFEPLYICFVLWSHSCISSPSLLIRVSTSSPFTVIKSLVPGRISLIWDSNRSQGLIYVIWHKVVCIQWLRRHK